MEKIDKIVEKSGVSLQGNLDLDKQDREQLDILRVQQKIDREHALNAFEKDIENQTVLEK